MKQIEKNNRPDIHEVLESCGGSVPKLVDLCWKGANCTRQIKDRDGDVIDTVEDWNVRNKWASLLMTALGYMKTSETHQTTIISSQEREDVREFFRKVNSGEVV